MYEQQGNIIAKGLVEEKEILDYYAPYNKKPLKKIIIYIVAILIIMVAFLLTNNRSDTSNQEVASMEISTEENNEISPYQIVFGVLFVSVILYSSILHPILIKKYLKKQFHTNKLLQQEVEYIFSENGLHRKSESIDCTYKWDDIYKIIERENMLIIYESSNSVLILPKRFFNNDKELIRVRELIKENMSENKYEMINNK